MAFCQETAWTVFSSVTTSKCASKRFSQASIRPAGEEYCWMRSMLIPEHKAKGQSNSQWGPEVFPLSLFVVKMGKWSEKSSSLKNVK